jgi:hypothetical protein
MQAPFTKAQLNAMHAAAVEVERIGRTSFAYKQICDEVKRHASVGKQFVELRFEYADDIKQYLLGRLEETFPDSSIAIIPKTKDTMHTTIIIDWTM